MFRTRHTAITTVELDDLSAQAVAQALSKKLQSAPTDFFVGTPMVVDLQQANADTRTLQQLKTLFAKQQLTLIGVCNHQVNSETLSAAGLADITPSQTASKATETSSTPAAKLEKKPAPETPVVSGNPTMVVRRHVRSGQRVYAPGADLVIIGTVGAGAEIIADGHISVFGSLRGRAFAGAKGEASCFIYASELAAELLSIAGCYQNMEQLEVYKGLHNCLITLTNDQQMHVVSL